MSFGERLRELRLKKGLTLEQVTKFLGYKTVSYVSDVELGKFIPKPEKLGKLVRALGMSQGKMNDLLLEAKLEKLGLTDPTMTLMMKEIPKMTKEEKESIVKAYEAVIEVRKKKRENENSR